MEPLTPDDVQAVLAPLGIALRFFTASTATSQMAADNIGCALGQIVKSLCFIAGEAPVLVLASGDTRVDDKKLAALLGVSRRQVRTATPAECVTIFGYEPGGVPPIAHRTQVPVYLEAKLERFDTLYAAGGAHNAIFPISLPQLRELTRATVADLAKT